MSFARSVTNALMGRPGLVGLQRIGNLLVGSLLVIVGCAMWLIWVSQTTTGEACHTGAATSGFDPIVFVALAILAPVGVGVHARRAGLPIMWALPAVAAAGFLAVIAVFLTGQVWWSAHGCIT